MYRSILTHLQLLNKDMKKASHVSCHAQLSPRPFTTTPSRGLLACL